jgi:hypothetical protein
MIHEFSQLTPVVAQDLHKERQKLSTGDLWLGTLISHLSGERKISDHEV